MANTINAITKYADIQLDEVFMANAKTAILEGNNDLLNFTSAKTVKIPDILMDGLGDYSKTGGFPKGSVTLSWTEYTLNKDRGKEFMIDNMDNEETAGLAFGKLATEFMRVHVIPEVDAYRLSTLYANAPSANKTTIALTAANILSTFNADEKKFADNEIETTDLVRFISTNVDLLIKNSTEISKRFDVATYQVGSTSEGAAINVKVLSYNGIPHVVVPPKRFKTAYTFYTGDSNKFGFEPTSSAKDIDFMTVHKNAAIPVKKHEKVRVFTPDVNQKADAYLFQYRLYHDIFVPKNKILAITANTAAA